MIKGIKVEVIRVIWFCCFTFFVLFIIWTMLVVAHRADEQMESDYYQKPKEKNS